LTAIDLAFDLPAAVAALEVERRRAVERINARHDELAEQLRAANEMRGAPLPTLADAAAVVAFDFETDPNTQIREVRFGASPYGSHTDGQQLTAPLAGGKYRALILLTVRR
jgi:hypothetical protein